MKDRIKNVLWHSIGLLPLRMRLSMRLILIKARLSGFENEWHILQHLGPNRGTALDIGANRGLYTLKLARLYDKVVAFEPNSAIVQELIALRHPKILVRDDALSSSSGNSKLFIPISQAGESLDGWASLNRENLSSRSGHQEIDVPTSMLDELRVDDVTFIKMDVEGHECEVIKGGLDFLAKHRPVLLAEIRQEHLEATRSLLEGIGLRPAPLPEPKGRDMHLFRTT